MSHTPERDGAVTGGTGRLRQFHQDFLKRHHGAAAVVLAGMVLQTLLGLPIPLLQGRAVDGVVRLRGGAAGEPETQSAAVLLACLIGGALSCHLARSLLAWVTASVAARVSQDVVASLTEALHEKLQRLPLSYFDRQPTGLVMARLTSDVGSILLFLSGGGLQLVADLVLATGVVVLLTLIHTRLAVVTLMALPFYVAIHRIYAGPLRLSVTEVRRELGSLYGLLSERLSAVRLVRAFGRSDSEQAEFGRRVFEHEARCRGQVRVASAQAAFAGLLSGLGSVLVLGYGCKLAGEGELSVGQWIAFFTMTSQLYGPLVRLTQFHGMLVGTLVALERMYEVLDQPVEGFRRRPRFVRRGSRRLTYRGVTFRYHADGPAVIDGVDLEVPAGYCLGVIGPSGSGKSTLLALAPRLYDLAEGHGRLELGGIDVREIPLRRLRTLVRLVPQQPFLFEGTIRSNLLFADPGATETRMEKALEVVELAATVASLPKGLDTQVGERGVTLSGGQRQRLALARAVLADSEVLLLDDCTSALDAETESRVHRSLAHTCGGRTRIVVSHKVSAVRDADQIVVVDSGRIVESGRHDELVARGGRYGALALWQQSSRSIA